jgi:hypothetical protein
MKPGKFRILKGLPLCIEAWITQCMLTPYKLKVALKYCKALVIVAQLFNSMTQL